MKTDNKKVQEAEGIIVEEYHKIYQLVEKAAINQLIYGEDYAKGFNKCAPKLSKEEEDILEQMYKLDKEVEDDNSTTST